MAENIQNIWMDIEAKVLLHQAVTASLFLIS